MIDPFDDNPMVVHTDGDAGPYLIVVPGEHCEKVELLLRENRIGYARTPDAIRLDGITVADVLNLGNDADVAEVQQVLDSVE